MSTIDDTGSPDEIDTDGAVGAGAAGAPDLALGDGGDATGGGSPGDPDDMGADEEMTLDEQLDEGEAEPADDLPIGSSGPESRGALRDKGPDGDVDAMLDGPDIQHPSNWRIS